MGIIESSKKTLPVRDDAELLNELAGVGGSGQYGVVVAVVVVVTVVFIAARPVGLASGELVIDVCAALFVSCPAVAPSPPQLLNGYLSANNSNMRVPNE